MVCMILKKRSISVVSRLAEAMDTQPPVMPEDGHTTRMTSGDDNVSQSSGKEPAAPEPIWDDEDTRSFYESLPDLRCGSLFGSCYSPFCMVFEFSHVLSACTLLLTSLP